MVRKSLTMAALSLMILSSPLYAKQKIVYIPGPPGPAGPAGPPGPIGPAGPSDTTWVSHQGAKSSGEPCYGYGFWPPYGDGQPVEPQLFNGTVVAFDNASNLPAYTYVAGSDTIPWDYLISGSVHVRNDGNAPANVEIQGWHGLDCQAVDPATCYNSIMFNGVLQPGEDKFIPFRMVEVKLASGQSTFFVTGTADPGSTISCISAEYQTDENGEGVIK